jgi:hypothetical protein
MIMDLHDTKIYLLHNTVSRACEDHEGEHSQIIPKKG